MTDPNPHTIDQCAGPARPNPLDDERDPVLLAVVAIDTEPLTASELATTLDLYTDSRPYRFDRYRLRDMRHTREGKALHLITLARARGHDIRADPGATGAVFSRKEEP